MYDFEDFELNDEIFHYLTSDGIGDEEFFHEYNLINLSVFFCSFLFSYRELESVLGVKLKTIFAPIERENEAIIQEKYFFNLKQYTLRKFWTDFDTLFNTPLNVYAFKKTLEKAIFTLEKDDNLKKEVDEFLFNRFNSYYSFLLENQPRQICYLTPWDFKKYGFCRSCPENGKFCIEKDECITEVYLPKKKYCYYTSEVFLEELKKCLNYVNWADRHGANKILYISHR